MTQEMTLTGLIGQLTAEQLLDEAGKARAEAYLESRSIRQPWYIRTMVGFGAWLASLLLIGFIGGFAFALESGYAIVGLVFIGAAIVVRRKNNNDFLVQASLAVSLAGQALLGWGVVAGIGSDNFEVFLIFTMLISPVMFVVFPDRIHRVLMLLFFVGSATALLYFWGLNAAVPVLAPMLTAAVIGLHHSQPGLIGRGYGDYVGPLMNGLMLSAFGVLMLSTVYILPELGTVDPQIYPRPWISTILFGAMLLYLASKIAARHTESLSRASRPALGLLLIIVIGASWYAPGLVLALIIVMLGAASGHKNFIAAGIAFFTVFLATYFYGIEVSLKTKSMTLVATGAAILLARWLILKMISTSGQGGEQDA